MLSITNPSCITYLPQLALRWCGCGYGCGCGCGCGCGVGGGGGGGGGGGVGVGVVEGGWCGFGWASL